MPQRNCAHCLTPKLVNGSAATAPMYYCSKPDCRRARNRRRMRDFNAKNPGYYGGRPSRTRYAAERAAGTRPSNRSLNPASAQAADQRRRARLAQVEVEEFSPLEVFERDNWICGICAGEVDRTLRYPDPMSVSLDHIVPISVGGGHTRDNTRCSHLRCNVLRGNRE